MRLAFKCRFYPEDIDRVYFQLTRVSGRDRADGTNTGMLEDMDRVYFQLTRVSGRDGHWYVRGYRQGVLPTDMGKRTGQGGRDRHWYVRRYRQSALPTNTSI